MTSATFSKDTENARPTDAELFGNGICSLAFISETDDIGCFGARRCFPAFVFAGAAFEIKNALLELRMPAASELLGS